jgi:hypothetical protein
VDISGAILVASGKCPDIAFVVKLITIKADRDTDFKKGGCKDLRVGLNVSVTGTVQPDHTVKATLVEIDK